MRSGRSWRGQRGSASGPTLIGAGLFPACAGDSDRVMRINPSPHPRRWGFSLVSLIVVVLMPAMSMVLVPAKTELQRFDTAPKRPLGSERADRGVFHFKRAL